MTIPQPSEPAESPDGAADELGLLAHAAVLAALAAVGVAVTTALAGGSMIAIGAALDAAVVKATARLARRGPRLVGRALTAAARRGSGRARAELAALGITPRRPTLLLPGGRAQSQILQVVDLINRAARRLLHLALTAADTAGDDEQARLDAAQRALARATDRGPAAFVDDRGRRWNADTYLRWALQAAAIDTELVAHHAWLLANGVDLVSVTTNVTQCPRCRPYEGKILTIRFGGAGTVTARGVEGAQHQVEVAGSVASARAAGLLHVGCAHRLIAWVPGVTVDIEARPPEAATADAQRLGAVARHIRHWERRRAVALTRAERRRAERRLAMWRAEQRRRPRPRRAA